MPGTELPSDIEHAVRGRVAALQPFLDVLLQGDAGPLTEEQRVCLEAIERNLRRLFTDVTETLELLRPDVAQLRLDAKELSCADLFHGAAQLLRTRALPEPFIREPGGAMRVRADAARTEAVLAALAARAGVPVSLSARRCDAAPDQVCVTVGPAAGVEPGCPPAETQEPVDASLLLCRALVEAQGGRLWLGAGDHAAAACVALPAAGAASH